MIRKNLLLFVIALTFGSVLSACGSSNHDEGTSSAGRESDTALSQEEASSAPENAEPVEEAESEKTEAAEEAAEDGSENNGNILIAYFLTREIPGKRPRLLQTTPTANWVR